MTLHNIPEGMAVGVVYAGFLAGDIGISAASAMVLALGIAIQNFPRAPLFPCRSRRKACPRENLLDGCAVRRGGAHRRPVDVARRRAGDAGDAATAFAAGAMMYVVVEELIPEMSEGKHSNTGTIAFSLGFVLMMILDVTLG